MTEETTYESTAALRKAFDERFAQPDGSVESERLRCVAFRIGNTSLAAPIEQLTGLHRIGRLLALPGARRGLLGLQILRGRLIPIFELARFVELESKAPPELFFLTKDPEPVGLGFEELEGCIEIEPTSAHPVRTDRARGCIDRIIRLRGEARMLVSIDDALRRAREEPT